MQCYQHKDSGGFDICQVTQTTLHELYKICQFIPHAVGFNSGGWIKYHISTTSMTDCQGSNIFLLNKPALPQLTSKSLPEIWCINLQRRPDRMEFMKMKEIPLNFFDAVDGQELTMTDSIKKLFKDNDFNYRSAIIGCCLSHFNLWKQLAASDKESYLILEDDVELCDDFMDKLSHACAQVEGKDWDFLYLGFTIYNQDRNFIEKELWNAKFPKVTPFDSNFVGAGFFSYIISKQGAQKMIQHIEENGIKCAIDSIPRLLLNVNRFSTIPHLVKTPYVGPGSDHIDTDIQTDLRTLL